MVSVARGMVIREGGDGGASIGALDRKIRACNVIYTHMHVYKAISVQSAWCAL